MLEGTPSTALAYVAVLPKVALLSMLVQLNNLFQPILANGSAVVFIGYTSLVAGGVGAIAQHSWRRMLAFGGTAQLGTAALALVCADAYAATSVVLYTFVYSISTVVLLTVLGLTSAGTSLCRGHRYLLYLEGC